VLHKGRGLAFPRITTPSHFIAMGMDPDLDDAAKQALREMIKWIGELSGLEPADAYMLCSLACDLRITQTVDGNKGVHAMLADAEKRPKRNAHFARRNETFRRPGRKSLESLRAPNRAFRGIVCFQ
jgi:hypothetical protein